MPAVDTLGTRATSDPIPASDFNDNAALEAIRGDLWAPTGALATNMPDRAMASASVAQTAITAIHSWHAGMVLRPGVTYTNVNAFCTAAGAGTVTTFWWAVVRLSDRQVLQRTANSTTLPTISTVHTRAFQATFTVSSATPVWIGLATQVGTTSPGFAGTVAASSAPLMLQAPILAGNCGTSPTATPPALATVLTAPTTGNVSRIYAWLT
jgi:hypothetical protein